MSFDIQYLLMLQDLRNATGGIFDEFFNAISKIAVDVMVFLPFLIFWAVDKAWGYRFMAVRWLGEVINGLVKLTVCAYRPWIRSDLIEPAGDSKVAATGYSFPSGHTMCATAMYGSVFIWQRNKRRWLAVLCAVAIALTAFSRNFLGVHTPQDVLVSFVETSLLLLVIGIVIKKADGSEKVYDILSVVGVIFIIASLVYILVKPYPMDYVDGVLLVDPVKMMKDCFVGCGGLLGLIIGSYVERHYIHYEIPKGAASLPLMAGVGVGIVFSWTQYMGPAIFVTAFGRNWGNMISSLLISFFAVAVWPIFIMKVARKETEKAAA